MLHVRNLSTTRTIFVDCIVLASMWTPTCITKKLHGWHKLGNWKESSLFYDIEYRHTILPLCLVKYGIKLLKKFKELGLKPVQNTQV